MKKNFTILGTDFYQISMVAAYLLADQANDRAGFEAFCRNIKPIVNPKKDCYFFNGGTNVRAFMLKIAEEVNDPDFIDAFITLIEPKLPVDRSVEYINILRERLKIATKEFEWCVYSDYQIVKPYVPVFQFNGPIWIGQLIETPILNLINGRTGLETRLRDAASYREYHEAEMIQDIVAGYSGVSDPGKFFNFYLTKLKERAKEYREATDKVILEAGFRRAPSLFVAIKAAEIALKAGWDGTSNVAAFQYYDYPNYTFFPAEKVGGTMAHSFIMSQPDELTAYRIWNDLFPNSTLLVDTYDVQNAVKMLVANNIKPKAIRIDSEPLDTYAFACREILDDAKWYDVDIFLSSDITPEMLRKFEKDKVPYNRVMAGTEYVNICEVKSVNAGFVYKLVEIEKGEEVLFPQKISTNKKNYSGLKAIVADGNNIKVVRGFGLDDAKHITRFSDIDFTGVE